jgi:uncharacterized protein (TIGR02284 family)
MMEKIGKNILETLTELTQFVNDGREGYARAAKESKNPQTEQIYRMFSSQRAEFGSELNNLIRSHGGEPEFDTTAKGKLYRGWMDVKASLTGSDEEAILDANLYGEEWAQKAYQEALEDSSLPASIRSVIQRQQQASLETYQQLLQLKNSVA